jgi:hypothetical protein
MPHCCSFSTATLLAAVAGLRYGNLPLDFSLALPDITLPGCDEEELDVAGLEY